MGAFHQRVFKITPTVVLVEFFFTKRIEINEYPGFDLGASILESLGLHGSPKMESPGGNVESQT